MNIFDNIPEKIIYTYKIGIEYYESNPDTLYDTIAEIKFHENVLSSEAYDYDDIAEDENDRLLIEFYLFKFDHELSPQKIADFEVEYRLTVCEYWGSEPG